MDKQNREEKERKKVDKGKARLSLLHPNSAGIDIGSETHYVAVPGGRSERTVERFGCVTGELKRMGEWLKSCGIDKVAMESTGVYWIPVFQILESMGLKVCLVNARYVKNVPGRKTDVIDCQWIQRLHSYGLLEGSFRPDQQICVLRTYVRHREGLIQRAASHVQRMQKALIQMNIQLHKAISDITGSTGLRIIDAILSGERDTTILAKLRDGRIKKSIGEIALSLEGDYRQEHLFTLRQERDLYEIYRHKMSECDEAIERHLTTFPVKNNSDLNPLPQRRKPYRPGHSNKPTFDLRTALYQMTGLDLTIIDGLDVLAVQSILSEIGLDMTRWPTEKHFCSWLGLCPSNRITGGKIKSSKSRHVINRAANTFRISAMALANSKTALGGYYRRMRTRLGAPKAITATANKLARIFYRALRFGKAYIDIGLDTYEKKFQQRVLITLKRRAHELGYELMEKQYLTQSVT
jgi:transposase